ncbi:MAG: hypothetical protein QOE55_1425 [Acidobacteriaceae bacterium]|nr:hypothetical protein [Acidobacteriaceae bacterium]
MQPMIRIFVLAAVFASASSAFAFDRAAVNVPFSFKTHGETLPAGTYEVEFDWIHHTLKLSSKTDTKMSYVWIAAPAQVSPDIPTLSLKFDGRTDGTHLLRSIRLATWTTPVLDMRERHIVQHEAASRGSR